jgi:hypothetical protein
VQEDSLILEVSDQANCQYRRVWKRRRELLVSLQSSTLKDTRDQYLSTIAKGIQGVPLVIKGPTVTPPPFGRYRIQGGTLGRICDGLRTRPLTTSETSSEHNTHQSDLIPHDGQVASGSVSLPRRRVLLSSLKSSHLMRICTNRFTGLKTQGRLRG